MSKLYTLSICLLVSVCAAAQAQTKCESLVDFSQPGALAEFVDPTCNASLRPVDGRELLAIPNSSDPYQEASWRIKVPGLAAHAGETVVVELHFLDAGAGVISASLSWPGVAGNQSIAAGRRRSYTRCNTGTERLTALEFALPAKGEGVPVLTTTGLQYPLRLVVRPKQEAAYWDALKAALPKAVRPLVTLERPMRLVTTAGVDVMGGMDTLSDSLDHMAEIAPLCKALGMTSIEGYVTWKRLEPNKEGEFDFTYYDAIVNKLAEYDLKFFPLLIVGSGYALPEWFINSPENVGFVCLEHGVQNAVQSIWSPTHKRHVERVLKAFGDHYGPMHCLEAVRLGPSGNYGESQYPAGGNWGPRGKEMHIHIGWWAGDAYAREDFKRFLKAKYPSIEALNSAWGSKLADFEAVNVSIPTTMVSRRQRADFTQWYTDSMTDWCNYWGGVVREALPDTPIYQSAGGWGFREAGTEYSAQAEGMKPIGGGIRLTNETDSYEQNVYATRLAATSAKLYGLPLGYEPASGHTARGVVGRIFNTLTTNGNHLFTYEGNLINSQLSIDKWLTYVPLFETRCAPLIEVAVYYPETENQLDDGAFRNLYAWGFNPRAAAVRRVVDVDYLDDHLILEGFLDRYKVLVCVWGDTIAQEVQDKMDAFLRAGGTVLYPSFPRGPMRNVDGEYKTYQKWVGGDIGSGRFARFNGDMEPPSLFGDFVREQLLKTESLGALTKTVIAAERPDQTFLSLQEDGHLLGLNYTNRPAHVVVGGDVAMDIEPYGIVRVALKP